MSSDPLVRAIREAIVEDWHDAGMYGRADFDPRWLDGLASVTAQAAANAAQEKINEAWAVAAQRRSEARRYYVAWQVARMRAQALLRRVTAFEAGA